MSIHGVVDELSVRLGALISPKYFREGAESPPLDEHLGALQLDSQLELERMDAEEELSVNSLVGRLDALVRRERWCGAESPTVIYHHGASEIPYDYGFRRIFPARDSACREVNLFAVRAPWHGSRKDFSHGGADLSRWMAMLAASVTVLQELVRALRQKDAVRIAISGTSLGGFITNLHHIYHDSADLYLPIMAGLAMDEPYLDSVYSRSVTPLDEGQRKGIRRLLNFEEGFASRGGDNVFPLLAEYDRLLTFERQGSSYGDCPVQAFAKGHTTGAIAFADLRAHVFHHLQGG